MMSNESKNAAERKKLTQTEARRSLLHVCRKQRNATDFIPNDRSNVIAFPPLFLSFSYDF